MGRQGYISEFMNGGRILSHGKIESLANGFSLPNDALFSLYIRPKYSSSSVDAVLSFTAPSSLGPIYLDTRSS